MLAVRLKKARQRKKLTQEELAKKLKTTKGTISNYENGHSSPSNEMLKDLADVLDVSTDYLLGRTDNPNIDIVKDEEDFLNFINDPSLKVWYKELPKSNEEELRRLRAVWEIIKNEDPDSKE